jgi:hypothetical protein
MAAVTLLGVEAWRCFVLHVRILVIVVCMVFRLLSAKKGELVISSKEALVEGLARKAEMER